MNASMDLDRSTRNPALSRALEQLAKTGSDAAKDAVLEEIQRATYLIAVAREGALASNDTATGADGAALPQQSELQILTAEQDDLQFLPLFTDWQEIADYTNLDVQGLVMPAGDAWRFALADGNYDGVVINPAGDALPLGKPLLEFLARAASAS